ncbi:hypothetical protein H9V03_004675 [Salmonella enterica]|nr:hypothetical protein [Salmonella enterica]
MLVRTGRGAGGLTFMQRLWLKRLGQAMFVIGGTGLIVAGWLTLLWVTWTAMSLIYASG